MPDDKRQGLSEQELADQTAADLPDREAMSLLDGLPDASALVNTSLLDLNVNVDAAAPINAAVAANANVAAPIDAAVSANILSANSTSVANAPQQSLISQTLDGVANATQQPGRDHRSGRDDGLGLSHATYT